VTRLGTPLEPVPYGLRGITKPEEHDWTGRDFQFRGKMEGGRPVRDDRGFIEPGDTVMRGRVIKQRYVGRDDAGIPEFELEIRSASGHLAWIRLVANRFLET